MPQLLKSISVHTAPCSSDNSPTTCLDSVKLNSIRFTDKNGKHVVLKQRNPSSFLLSYCANFYFYFAHIPIHFFSSIQQWKSWEIDCFEALNGDDNFHATATAPNQVCFDKLAGKNLWDHALAGTLTLKMVRAAAREFQRTHQIWMPQLNDFWSHGDAGLSNLIYEQETERARLIDFEIAHDKTLSTAQRHADDLLVFLQDLVGTLPDEEWLLYATTFLKTYSNRAVIRELKEQLFVPQFGLRRLWWHHRTCFAKISKIRLRYEQLQQALDAYLEDVCLKA